MPDIDYFDDSWDSDFFFVCMNRFYIFAADRNADSPEWEFIDPRSARWDAVHQRLYGNGRADKVSKDELPANLPPPPQSIPPEAINLPPLPKKLPLLAASYPVVTRYLMSCKDNSAEIYAVLIEDLYESQLGDGKFHYPDSVFLDELTAREYCNKSQTENDAYHLRQCTLKLDGAVLVCDLSLQLFDHLSGRGVLEMMNMKLDGASSR